LGLNFTSHLYDHAFKYSKSVLINVCNIDVLIERTSKQLNILRKLKYLYELVPPLVAANVNYNLRNSHNIHVPFNRLSVYQNSYFPCLCICTGDSEILLKSNSTLFSKCLVLKIIISVLLGLNFTSHLYDHAFKYSKSVHIVLALDKKQITSITFADISKAFDTVWIKALILKLENYGIKGKLLFWLKSYLSRRKQQLQSFSSG
jgi:hypothetical protein